MPTSRLDLIAAVIDLGWVARPRRVLDVGVGHGKYGLLAREYWPTVAHLAAVEAEGRYLDRHPWLHTIYDTVHHADIVDVDVDTFDLVLLVDVIEHLDRPAGLALIDRIAGHALISTPTQFFQNPDTDEWPTETHRSVWSAADFAQRCLLDWSTSDTVLVLLAPKEAR